MNLIRVQISLRVIRSIYKNILLRIELTSVTVVTVLEMYMIFHVIQTLRVLLSDARVCYGVHARINMYMLRHNSRDQA